jgi:hypothetical protein
VLHSGGFDRRGLPSTANKKTDLADHPEVINQTGLLINEPPSIAGLLFI